MYLTDSERATNEEASIRGKRVLRSYSDESSNPGDESAFVSYPYAGCERSLLLGMTNEGTYFSTVSRSIFTKTPAEVHLTRSKTAQDVIFRSTAITPFQDLGSRPGCFETTAENFLMPMELSMKRFGQVFAKLRKL